MRRFVKHLISFTNQKGEFKKGLPFETDEYYYLIRMTEAKAKDIIKEDDDYDQDGNLLEEVKEQYEEKHDGEDFLNNYNDNTDNDLGTDTD